MADIEHADPGPHRHVLLPDPGVLHGHLPPGERHQPRTRGRMAIVQRRALQRFGARSHSRPDPSSASGPSGGVDSRAMRARMRGLAEFVVVAAALPAGAPPASAGTYDVVSCGAPGAGGVNRAWRPEFGAFPPIQ